VSEVLDDALAERPDDTAVVTRSGATSYRDLDDLVNSTAAALVDAGLQPGDRVAACLPNDLDIVVHFHAVMRLGAIWAGLSAHLVADELVNLIRSCQPKILLLDEATAARLEGPLREAGSRARVIVICSGSAGTAWHEEVAAHRGSARPPSPDPRRPAGIAYTSGTVGSPKGIVHSQANLLLPGAAIVASRRYDSQLRKGDFLPLTILNLIVLTTLLTAQAKGTSYLYDGTDARGMATWIKRHRLSAWNAVPPVLYTMAHDDSIAADSMESLDDIWSGGAACPEEIRAAFRAKFGKDIHMTYGQTEAPSAVAITPRGERAPAGSSGKVLPHVVIEVRDPVSGDLLSAGEEGEICVAADPAGPFAGRYRPMLGLWGALDTVPADESLHTDDLGRVDEDGTLFVTGRRSQMIIRGGANIYPSEVEATILAMPAVQECVVIGVADVRLGERVAAVVQRAAGGAVEGREIREFCSSRLAHHKVPEYVEFVDDFPRNAMGKVVRTMVPSLIPARPERLSG